MITPTFISTAALSSETKASIARIQKQLVDAQTELSTGRHADVGVTLGAQTGVSVSLRQDIDQIQSIKDTNSLVLTRMEGSQAALNTLATTSQTFLDALTPAQSAGSISNTIVGQAQAAMQSLQDQLNTSLDGQYLFAGINSDVKPLDDYFSDPPSAAAQAVKNAFVAKFGMSPDDPNVSSISATDMQDFLNNEFSDLFSDANWSANWSAASDKPINSRISRTETANTSVTATDGSFRQLAQAFTMISSLGFSNLNSNTQQVVMQQATQLVSNGMSALTKVQSFLGVTQQRVSDANDQIDTQTDFLNKSIDGLESVDTAAITTQISDLSTALEAAYAVTNRLSNLSIMDYLTS
ncbi:flagellar hook-associated family protein [Hyphomicrobium sp.]|jgi:flagellar hook-associated protein 3 FlgL|uniref:flagellar hook-associated family protein n=1 Tax=Hyphomicrobium sp. TaxID=82 RepID=UPI002B87C41B|nr:flagellar hook-associated family protein [Hyphomicrobium sp.]HVZ04398.1 flagellar hook-associated family protein [Hyphomicrobium sp.]